MEQEQDEQYELLLLDVVEWLCVVVDGGCVEQCNSMVLRSSSSLKTGFSMATSISVKPDCPLYTVVPHQSILSSIVE